MSFDGDLEHLPIVDVIQLLHATGKSGTLTLRSLKGESQIVFHSGYIVSANHVNNSVRIGQVLIDMGMIAPEELESALHEQQRAGAARKPIIQTMIEAGKIRTEDAYQGLEVLIEMTIVEVLTWTRGTFSLDVDKIFVSDEYRYFPEQLQKEIQLNTQSVLMDALRIYDERKRDGTLTTEAMFGVPPTRAPVPSGPPGPDISAADLGLDDLDSLERIIPTPFSGLADIEPDTPRTRLARSLAGIAPEEQERLYGYLEGITGASGLPADGTGVILFSADKLVRECVATACGPHFRCATDDAAGLDPILDQSLSKGVVPLLLLDPGEPGARSGNRETLLELVRQKREKYPELAVVLLACPGDFRLTALALQTGIAAVLPRASREERPESLVADTIDCTEALSRYLKGASSQPDQGLLQQFRRQFLTLSEQREPSEVTFQLLQSVASFFDRAVTLVVVRTELIAERGIGIAGAGATSSVKLRLPLTGQSLFQQALKDGESFFGEADLVMRETLFATIGTPAVPKALLLPIKSFGRVIALIYADFGTRAGGAPQLELLEMLAQHASLVIDNALYRKRVAQKAAS
jgi:DNA-binding NarL/FixJ family response regulator